MSDLGWILTGGLGMAAVASIGGLTAWLSEPLLRRLLLPLVAIAAGSLLGGAFFHLLPAGLAEVPAETAALWIVSGFTLFLALEQFLHWHHCHRASAECRSPVTYLILLGDGLHNFLGGIAIASAFLLDARAGIAAWCAAVAHEIPQELGDFGVLVHGGWSRRRALAWNVLSGLTFPLGAVLTYALSTGADAAPLALFGAGNFLYIAAADLVPEIKAHERLRAALVHFGCFAGTLALMYVLAHSAH